MQMPPTQLEQDVQYGGRPVEYFVIDDKKGQEHKMQVLGPWQGWVQVGLRAEDAGGMIVCVG